MEPLDHFRVSENLHSTSYFALNGHYIGVRLFWMPMLTKEGREIKMPVIADQKVSGRGVKDYTKIPVLRVEHVSEDIVNRTIGILSVFTTDILRVVTDETPMAFAGTIPNVRQAKEGERFLVPIAIDVQERKVNLSVTFSRMVPIYVLHVKPFVKLASSYIDALQKDFWDHALDVPDGMRWGEICQRVADGRLSFPFKVDPVYVDFEAESVPQHIVNMANERKSL